MVVCSCSCGRNAAVDEAKLFSGSTCSEADGNVVALLVVIAEVFQHSCIHAKCYDISCKRRSDLSQILNVMKKTLADTRSNDGADVQGRLCQDIRPLSIAQRHLTIVIC